MSLREIRLETIMGLKLCVGDFTEEEEFQFDVNVFKADDDDPFLFKLEL